MDKLCEYITETIVGYCSQKIISKEYKYQIRANNTQKSIAIDAYVFSHPYHDSIISIVWCYKTVTVHFFLLIIVLIIEYNILGGWLLPALRIDFD